jgi:LDH2 family malate/lactate/ureidoglycolate dehydrogenase
MAEAVADHVIESELAGHPSHGLRLVPRYCAAAGSPGVDLAAQPCVVGRRGAVTSIDAMGGLGYLALAMAVDCAAESAEAFGVGIASVRRCGHAGRAGAWVELGVARGHVTMVLLGGSAPPFVLASGPGSSPALHTNPISIGVPAVGHPLVLDMATSVVAEGKVHVALERGAKLPDRSVLSSLGVASNDPRDFVDGGCLLPVGAHKGFGLSAMIEALAVSFTGADGPEMEPPEGALVSCMAASAFRPVGDVGESLERLRTRLRSSAGQKGSVMAPGDIESASREAARGWVEISEELAGLLHTLAAIPHGGECAEDQRG